jgi:hypothetical protein
LPVRLQAPSTLKLRARLSLALAGSAPRLTMISGTSRAQKATCGITQESAGSTAISWVTRGECTLRLLLVQCTRLSNCPTLCLAGLITMGRNSFVPPTIASSLIVLSAFWNTFAVSTSTLLSIALPTPPHPHSYSGPLTARFVTSSLALFGALKSEVIIPSDTTCGLLTVGVSTCRVLPTSRDGWARLQRSLPTTTVTTTMTRVSPIRTTSGIRSAMPLLTCISQTQNRTFHQPSLRFTLRTARCAALCVPTSACALKEEPLVSYAPAGLLLTSHARTGLVSSYCPRLCALTASSLVSVQRELSGPHLLATVLVLRVACGRRLLSTGRSPGTRRMTPLTSTTETTTPLTGRRHLPLTPVQFLGLALVATPRPLPVDHRSLRRLLSLTTRRGRRCLPPKGLLQSPPLRADQRAHDSANHNVSGA